MKKALPPVIACAVIVIILRLLSLFSFTYSQIVYSAVSIVLFIGGSFVLKLSEEKKSRLRRFLKFRLVKLTDIPVVFWMTLTVISGSFLLNLLSLNVFTSLGVDIGDNVLSAYDTKNLWLSVVTLGVLPAVLEELFFRGAMMSVLSKEKTIFAVLISSALFALVHGSFYLTFSNFFAGVAFGITVYITDSILASILTHFLNNIMAYTLFTYSGKLATTGFDNGILFIILFVFLISLYGAVSVTAKRYKRSLNESKPIINEGEIIWEKRKEERQSKKY